MPNLYNPRSSAGRDTFGKTTRNRVGPTNPAGIVASLGVTVMNLSYSVSGMYGLIATALHGGVTGVNVRARFKLFPDAPRRERRRAVRGVRRGDDVRAVVVPDEPSRRVGALRHGDVGRRARSS